jgi:hypothetical protein
MTGEICRLCQKKKQLRNSHILPEFFYQNMYDDKHRYLQVPSDAKEKFAQKGIREYLLCQECETKLSRYEKYAAEIIREIPNFLLDLSERFTYSEDVDYSRFKLFQLSIIWRAGISTSKMFESVSLGKHEEIIRKMVDEENPGKSSDYGCLMITVPDTRLIDKIIWSPTREKLFGHNGYRFFTGNLFWYFFVSSHTPDRTSQEFFIKENGLLRIWIAPWREDEIITNIGSAFRSRKL